MRRLKKILKWIGIVMVGLAAIALIANALFVSITASRLERQIAAIRAAGDPVTIADLAPPPIPAEKNAATYLDRARADMEAIVKEISDLKLASECPGYRLPPKELKTINDSIAAYPKVLPLLQQAAACPEYEGGFDYTLPSQKFQEQMLKIAGGVRTPSRVLFRRAEALIAEGNCDEAIRMSILLLRLSRHFDRNPTIVGYLVALASRSAAIEHINEALQTGPVSKETREALDMELAIHEPMSGYKNSLKSERAWALSSIPSQDGMFGTMHRQWFVGRGMANMWMSDYLRFFDSIVSTADDSTTFPHPARAIVNNGMGSIPSGLILPSINATENAVARVRAEIRCLRVLNALQTRATEADNNVPKLAELGLPVETTTDPFNGQPLHAKKTPQGWLVYSVGQNQVDDGGNLANSASGDVGFGPPPAAPVNMPSPPSAAPK
jgi:hypothetical protein